MSCDEFRAGEERSVGGNMDYFIKPRLPGKGA